MRLGSVCRLAQSRSSLATADRKAANVPSSLSTSDSELGDSLSAGIASLQELINGMDTDNVAKIKDGFNKLDASMLSMAKAEADLGSELQ